MTRTITRFHTVELRCQCCSRKLEKGATWLELDSKTNLYHDPDHFPETGLSQGCFEFGETCARKVLKNGGRVN